MEEFDEGVNATWVLLQRSSNKCPQEPKKLSEAPKRNLAVAQGMHLGYLRCVNTRYDVKEMIYRLKNIVTHYVENNNLDRVVKEDGDQTLERYKSLSMP